MRLFPISAISPMPQAQLRHAAPLLQVQDLNVHFHTPLGRLRAVAGVNLALQAARAIGVSLPGTALTQELFNAAKAAEGEDLDHSALVKALEQLANHQIGSREPFSSE